MKVHTNVTAEYGNEELKMILSDYIEKILINMLEAE